MGQSATHISKHRISQNGQSTISIHIYYTNGDVSCKKNWQSINADDFQKENTTTVE
jgi:hypothetical protein